MAKLLLNLSLHNCKYSYDKICQSPVKPFRCAVLVDGADDCEHSNDSGDDVPVIARKGIVDVKAHAGAMVMTHVHIHVHFVRLDLQRRQGQRIVSDFKSDGRADEVRLVVSGARILDDLQHLSLQKRS